MDILSSLNNAILPGYRVHRFNGWESFEKFSIPRDSECIGLDIDDTKNYVYMKKVDANGVEIRERYKITPDPVEKFEPDF